ncbi:helix-turn-helix transcriptional regulator [Streptomyces griseoaurantiacus]|uniref:helix-turn-helix transcriptional regulator n=1 Tax=Streptomyces griseoaurantiacus TaxID=68213 RepID=UPI002E29446B|nr:LuxR family transcriptional regulator [Streptomyces jietaisiensis]
MPGPLSERTDVLELIAAEAARARAGTGGLVLLRGATGTGRTAVLEAAVRDAEAHGMRVLLARCAPCDQAQYFASLTRLLHPAQPTGRPAAGEHEPFQDRDERVVSGHLLLRVAELSEDRPLLVAVDDTHLADPASRRWLVEAARHVDRMPVLLLVTERSQYDIAPPTPGLAHTLPPDLVRTHTLAPLSGRSTALLARGRVGDAAWPRVESRVRASAGHPLLLHALLEDLGGSGAEAVPESSAMLYPGAYQAAVSWWLESAGPRTTAVARALAVLEDTWADIPGRPAAPASPHGSVRPGAPAHPATVRHLAEILTGMTGADPARIAGWLTATTGLGLLRPDAWGRPRWAHRLLRDAVLEGWSEDRRRAAHLAAADAMWQRGDSTAAVARQLLRAGAASRPWAVNVLRDAAREAAREGRAETAVAHLRRLLREPLSDPQRQRVLTELGSLECTAALSRSEPGDGSDSGVSTGIPRLTEALWLPVEPADRVRAAIALGTALARFGHTRSAVETLRGLDESGLSDRPALPQAVRAATVLLSEQDQVLRRQAYARLSEQAHSTPDLVGAAGRALLVRHAAVAGLISAREAMERLRALLLAPAEPETEPFLLGTAAEVAVWADDFDSAEQLADHALAGRDPHVLHPTGEILRDVRADLAMAHGTHVLPRHLLADRSPARTDPARHGPPACEASGAEEHPWTEHARADAEYAGPHDPAGPGAPSAPADRARTPRGEDARAVLALVAAGRVAAAGRFVTAFDLSRVPDSPERDRFLYARGVLRAAAGNPVGAAHDFLECGRGRSAREELNPAVLPWRTALAECAVARGDRREALLLAEDELRLARVWDTPRTVGRALRVLATATGGRHGLDLAEEAVRLLRTAPGGEELIAALLARGRLLLAAGERTQARETLREAADRAARRGAVRLAQAAEEALREGGARRPATVRTGFEALTDSERRIVELAAEGHTNTEIAGLLHVARRTVETHLTSAYRKLGIRRRGQLQTVLGAAAPRRPDRNYCPEDGRT